ncbi:HEPN domain-containing protein [Bacteroides congonensis]
MKRSIKRLPKRTQEELAVLQELILAYFANVRMIILYGSYARGKYVIWDETYDERGIITYYQSDLDILVICDTGDAIKAERYAREIIVPRYDKLMEGKRHPAPPSIIVETPAIINRAMRRKHYFFYEIIKDGILLYDDGTFQIGKPEKLPYREIKQYAEEEYAECFPLAEGFLKHGHLDKEEENYKLGSFELHQACERFYKTFTLVYSGIRPKSHELKVLGAMARNRSRGFANVFPTNTPEENKAFEKLCKAYIEARYNRLFTVSKEQYEYMLARTEVLREVTIRECAARLAYYDEMIEKEEKSKI